MTQYKSIVTASGHTSINLVLSKKKFILNLTAKWMGGIDKDITIEGKVKASGTNITTLLVDTLTDNHYNKIYNLIQNDESSMAFRLIDAGSNVYFDDFDNVSGCVNAGRGIFNTCYAINGTKCEKDCPKCFTYDTILIGIIAPFNYSECITEIKDKYFSDFEYNLLRRIY